MTELNQGNLTTSQLKAGIPNFQVQPRTIDEPGTQPETYWDNMYWSTYLGYLKTIPEYRNAVRALAIWTCGKGWTVNDSLTKTILENIRGWGEDTLDSILQMMIIIKKTNGDAYSEIIRANNKTKTLINLKPLNPAKVRHVVDKKGLILRYDVMNSDGNWEPIDKDKIFHISNDRIANEIHGTSVLESCKYVIDWKNELMADLRRMIHRSTIRVLYIDIDDTTKLGTIREQYKNAIRDGEVLILPGRKGEFEIVDYSTPPTQQFLEAIRYLDNYFYEILGVPKITTGGTQDYTEASSKVGYLTFEQPYMTEQRLLEQDIWNQLGIKIKFERPVSLKEDMVNSEAANTGQLGFQPNETTAQLGRTE